MKTVKQLKEKLQDNLNEIDELRHLIYTAQKICEHDFIDNVHSLRFKYVCSICDKVKYE